METLREVDAGPTWQEVQALREALREETARRKLLEAEMERIRRMYPGVLS